MSSHEIDRERVVFPDYGDGGDLAGAKRLRYSFKLCVLAVILLTFGMFVSEKDVRFGHTESLYISGVTMTDKASGRVQLVAAIKADAAANETATAKYTQALAVRQEDDVILRTYEMAQALDDKNTPFTIRHGSRLFIMGLPDEALRKFRKAQLLTEGGQQPNALPGYLQAAAIAHKRNEPGAIKQALIAVAKANNLREGAIVFPTPFWISSYPKDGVQYAQLQREIIDETCVPLITLTTYVTKAIDEKITKGQLDEARTWIGYLEGMGDRLLENSIPQGTIQAAEGVHIKLECNRLTQKIELAQEGGVSKDTLEAGLKLEHFRDDLVAYEQARDDRIEYGVVCATRPNHLVFGTWFVFLGLWFLVWCLCRLGSVQHAAWALAYNGFTKTVLAVYTISFFVLLVCLYSFNSLEGIPDEYLSFLSWSWLLVCVITLLMGLVYPLTMLVSPEEATRKQMRPEEMDAVIPYARVAYRRAYSALVLRYCGILSGVYTMVLCSWFLLYRLVQGLFPWQVNLLADGFLDQEVLLVQQLLTTL